MDLSARTLRFLAGRLTARRRDIATRWRRLPVARQALLVLAHLRCGDTYAQLAAGFGIGIATVYRYIREVIEVLGRNCPRPVPMPPPQAMEAPPQHYPRQVRCVGEQAMATLKGWRLLRKLRCSTNRITNIVKAVLVLHHASA
ncbi:transposase family protein [Streptomyces sp. NPDC058861]|uniref:helix-turn-helix domain-containing protein n=1 Tax=Streptomyces sp. NPDC058861 TaxID=3346653 RepID=UPI003678A012